MSSRLQVGESAVVGLFLRIWDYRLCHRCSFPVSLTNLSAFGGYFGGFSPGEKIP